MSLCRSYQSLSDSKTLCNLLISLFPAIKKKKRKKSDKKKNVTLNQKWIFIPVLKFFRCVWRRETYVSMCAFICVSYWIAKINNINVSALRTLFYSLSNIAWYFFLGIRYIHFKEKLTSLLNINCFRQW